MFRLVKKTGEDVEILRVSEDENEMLDALCEYIIENASNGDEYDSRNLDEVREQQSERIGNYEVYVDCPNELTDEKAISLGGGVCMHCHSPETNCEEPIMQDGHITRDVVCWICGDTTIERYELSGLVKEIA